MSIQKNVQAQKDSHDQLMTIAISKKWKRIVSIGMLCNCYQQWVFPWWHNSHQWPLNDFIKKKKKVKSCEVVFLSDSGLPVALVTTTLKKLHGLKQLGWHRKFSICKWKFKNLLPHDHLGKYSGLEHISTFPPNARQITETWTHLPFKKSIMLGGSLWIFRDNIYHIWIHYSDPFIK